MAFIPYNPTLPVTNPNPPQVPSGFTPYSPNLPVTNSLDQTQPQAPQKSNTGFLGTNPNDSLGGKLIDNSITRGIQNIFPGKQIGQGIGTSLQGLYQGAKTGSMTPIIEAGQENNKNAPKIFGDAANAVLTATSPLIGGGAGRPLARIGANTALGAGLGASNAVSQGEGIKGIAKDTAIGGGSGLAIGGGTELAGYLSKNMPNWFTKIALPKLSNSKVNQAPEDVINYALNNSKGATLKSMLNNSNAAKKAYEGQVQAILSHPDYINETGSKEILGNVMDKFSNAQLEPDKVIKYAKAVAPTQAALVDKVANGTATLAEKNTLRKALDFGTAKRFTDSPKLSFAKEVSGAMADALRTDVKSTAKETEPIFENYSKEHALNKALKDAISRKRVAGPLGAGIAGGAGGFVRGGLTGAIKGGVEGILIEEGLRSPTSRLLAAKGIQAVSKAGPSLNAVVQGGKAPLVNKLTSK